MELSDEQISCIWDAHTVPVFGKTGINPIVFARDIESEVRKDDEALIRQMLDVLSFLDSSDISLHQQGWHDLTKAIAAARARLATTQKESPCSTK